MFPVRPKRVVESDESFFAVASTLRHVNMVPSGCNQFHVCTYCRRLRFREGLVFVESVGEFFGSPSADRWSAANSEHHRGGVGYGRPHVV
jgi:hypothetical protein